MKWHDSHFKIKMRTCPIAYNLHVNYSRDISFTMNDKIVNLFLQILGDRFKILNSFVDLTYPWKAKIPRDVQYFKASVVAANTMHAWLEGQFIDVHICCEGKGHLDEWSEEWRENGEKKAFWPDIEFRCVFKLQ